MNRAFRRRHLLFFSTSLIVHILFVATLVGVLIIVSGTPSGDPGGPLVISLDRGGNTGTPPNGQGPAKESVVLKGKPSQPDVSGPKTAGEENREYAIGDGNTSGVLGSGGEAGGEGGAELANYISAVRARIDRHKRYPPTAVRDNVEGTVTVSFMLERHGTLLNRKVVIGSGSPMLDEAALAAVDDSSPFPPFPDGLDRETLLLRLPINYTSR